MLIYASRAHLDLTSSPINAVDNVPAGVIGKALLRSWLVEADADIVSAV